MDIRIIFLFAAIVIVAALVLGLVGIVRKGTGHLNIEKYRSKWLAVEQSLIRDKPETTQMAIINADKLVDYALKECGTAGKTMGERLKEVESKLTRADAVWAAHKLRNRIAHEADVQVSYDQARRALAGYKKALKDLGAI